MGIAQSSEGVANFNQECAARFTDIAVCSLPNTYVDVAGQVINFTAAQCADFVTTNTTVTLPSMVWGITGCKALQGIHL